jgi:hypothetical protein
MSRSDTAIRDIVASPDWVFAALIDPEAAAASDEDRQRVGVRVALAL